MNAFRRVALATAVSAAALVATAGAANAAPAAPQKLAVPAASNACLQIGVTHRSGNTIVGYGSISCGTGSATIEIWESRWYGWSTVASGSVSGASGANKYVYFNCAGTGTHNFETVIYSYALNGDYVSKTSNQISASC
jgi:hypothetical protein